MTGLFAAAEPADQRVAGFFSALFTGGQPMPLSRQPSTPTEKLLPGGLPGAPGDGGMVRLQRVPLGWGHVMRRQAHVSPQRKGTTIHGKKGRIMEFAAHPPKRGSCDLVQSFDLSPKTPLATPARPSRNANPVGPGKHCRQREYRRGVLPRPRERFSHGSTAKRQNKQPAKAGGKRSSALEKIFRMPSWSGFAAPSAWQRCGSRSAR